MAAQIYSQPLLKHPFTALISGSTGSGKTWLARRLIKNFRYTIEGLPPSIKVLWCYGQWQDLYSQPLGANIQIEYHDGLADADYIKAGGYHIILLDDLMNETGSDKDLANLFTKYSHHLQLSVLNLIQNLFFQSKYMRTVSLNCHYIFLLKNPRDRLQISTLGRQIFPKERGKKGERDLEFFMDAYDKATNKEFGYLCIDLRSDTPEKFRLRTRLTPEETPESLKKYIVAPIIYV